MARSKDPELQRARQALIADTAIECLSEGSWRSVTLSGVAKRAGVSKGVVTYWFATKDALIVEAVRRFHERYEQRLLELLSAEGTVGERLESLLELVLPEPELLRDEFRFHIEVLSFAKSNPEVEEQLRGAYEQFQRACVWMLEEGVREGAVEASVDVEGLALCLQALIDGLSMRAAHFPELDMVALRGHLLAFLRPWFSL